MDMPRAPRETYEFVTRASPPCGSSRRDPAGRDEGGHECTHQEVLRSVRRDLHDLVGSALAGMATQLELVARLNGTDHGRAQDVVAGLRAETAELITQVRRLAHGSADHRVANPEMALRTMVGRLGRAVSPRLGFTLDYDPAARSLPADIGSAVFWIAREAIINVVKHSQARRCWITLSVAAGELLLRVEDDGSAPLEPIGGGLGLITMAQRAAELGGWCRGAPLEPRGFAVIASIPVRREAAR